MSTASHQRVLTDEMVREIRGLFDRYPTRLAVVLPAIHVVNDALRHVSLHAVVEIAELLDLAPSRVQDTLTFYGFFKQDEPHGEIRAWVCRSIGCALRGGDDILQYMCDKLGIEPGGTTEDGKLTLEPAECLGVCEHGPCMLAGDSVYRDMTREKADEFLDSL